MTKIVDCEGQAVLRDESSLADTLAYAGLVLVTYELVKSMIIRPVQLFYEGVTFGSGCSFVSYAADVLVRDKSEYRACLLYLRDFMGALSTDDLNCIEELRSHRHVIAHELPSILRKLCVEEYVGLIERVDQTLFKLSNHHAYIELGADPVSAQWDWAQVWGEEYIMFNKVVAQLRSFGHIAAKRSAS